MPTYNNNVLLDSDGGRCWISRTTKGFVVGYKNSQSSGAFTMDSKQFATFMRQGITALAREYAIQEETA